MGSFGYADGAILAAPTVYAMKSVLKLCDHFGVISVKSILSLFPEYRAIPNINCSKAILWQFMVVFCGTTVLLLYDIFLNTIEKIIRQLLCLPYSLNTYRKPLPLNCNDIHVEIQVSKQFYS